MNRKNRQWRLKKRPEGDIAASDLEWAEAPVPELKDGEVLVRNVYLSLDPTNRIWMSDMDAYLPPVGIGEVMRGGTIGVVEESKSDAFEIGQTVMPGLAGWQDYEVRTVDTLNPIPAGLPVPMTAFMSVLGATGATAYFGMTEFGQPKEGETVVISAAAGAVGSVAGQIAKIKGARVVGIAGSDDKCRWITEELGFDGAINYKTEDVGARLDALCPDGIDVNFENVGGEIMEAVLDRMNDFSRMPLCGMISTYNATSPVPGPRNFEKLLMRRVALRGFIVIDFLDRFPEAFMAMGPWLMEGKLKYKVHVERGLENAPTAVGRLFTGDHDGKLLVQVSEEP